MSTTTHSRQPSSEEVANAMVATESRGDGVEDAVTLKDSQSQQLAPERDNDKDGETTSEEEEEPQSGEQQVQQQEEQQEEEGGRAIPRATSEDEESHRLRGDDRCGLCQRTDRSVCTVQKGGPGRKSRCTHCVRVNRQGCVNSVNRDRFAPIATTPRRGSRDRRARTLESPERPRTPRRRVALNPPPPVVAPEPPVVPTSRVAHEDDFAEHLSHVAGLVAAIAASDDRAVRRMLFATFQHHLQALADSR